jgi:hypothetical protein
VLASIHYLCTSTTQGKTEFELFRTMACFATWILYRNQCFNLLSRPMNCALMVFYFQNLSFFYVFDLSTFLGPYVQSVSPLTGPSAVQVTITITGILLLHVPCPLTFLFLGINFALSSIVTVGGVPCSAVSVTSSGLSITCQVPIGTGINNEILVSSDGNTSNAGEFFFSYDGNVFLFVLVLLCYI